MIDSVIVIAIAAANSKSLTATAFGVDSSASTELILRTSRLSDRSYIWTAPDTRKWLWKGNSRA